MCTGYLLTRSLEQEAYIHSVTCKQKYENNGVNFYNTMLFIFLYTMIDNSYSHTNGSLCEILYNCDKRIIRKIVTYPRKV